MENITSADFSGNKQTVTVSKAPYQWSYGQILRITGLDLPEEIEIHFSLTEKNGTAQKVVGITTDGVTEVKIPQFIFENEGSRRESYKGYVFIYPNDTESGETTHKIILNIRTRPKPEDYIYTEQEVGTYKGLEGRVVQLEEDLTSVQQVRIDWNENDETSPAYIKNRPFTVPAPGEDGKEKFLKGDGTWSEISADQSDWNENDPSAASYIWNQPLREIITKSTEIQGEYSEWAKADKTNIGVEVGTDNLYATQFKFLNDEEKAKFVKDAVLSIDTGVGVINTELTKISGYIMNQDAVPILQGLKDISFTDCLVTKVGDYVTIAIRSKELPTKLVLSVAETVVSRLEKRFLPYDAQEILVHTVYQKEDGYFYVQKDEKSKLVSSPALEVVIDDVSDDKGTYIKSGQNSNLYYKIGLCGDDFPYPCLSIKKTTQSNWWYTIKGFESDSEDNGFLSNALVLNSDLSDFYKKLSGSSEALLLRRNYDSDEGVYHYTIETNGHNQIFEKDGGVALTFRELYGSTDLFTNKEYLPFVRIEAEARLFDIVHLSDFDLTGTDQVIYLTFSGVTYILDVPKEIIFSGVYHGYIVNLSINSDDEVKVWYTRANKYEITFVSPETPCIWTNGEGDNAAISNAEASNMYTEFTKGDAGIVVHDASDEENGLYTNVLAVRQESTDGAGKLMGTAIFGSEIREFYIADVGELES